MKINLSLPYFLIIIECKEWVILWYYDFQCIIFLSVLVHVLIMIKFYNLHHNIIIDF